MDPNDFLALARSRASHRKYLPDAVSDEVLRPIIEAGRLAPSAHNFQPWRFIAVRDRDVIRRMAEAVGAVLDALRRRLPAEVAGTMDRYRFYVEHFREAPLAIAVATKACRYDPTDALAIEHGVALPAAAHFDMELLGVGAAVGNMLLAAQAAGLGSCWMTEPVVYAQKAIESVLGLEEPYRFVSLVTIGRPTKARTAAPRKAVEEILTIL